MEQPEPHKGSRDTVLDFWRGVSVLLVLLYHIAWFRFYDFFTIPQLAFQAILALSQHAGSLGVKIFFVISGHIITKTLLREEHLNGAINASRFYMRRFIKLAPPYCAYLVLVYVAVRVGYISGSGPYVRCVTLLANTVPKCPWSLTHIWTLSVEEQFYVFWPLIFLAVPRAWRTACCAMGFIGLSALSGLDIFTIGPVDNAGAFACILMGALYAFSEPLQRHMREETTIHLTIGAGAALISVVVFPDILRAPMHGLYAAGIPWGITAVLAGTHKATRIIRSRTFGYVSALGIASYSIYIFQQLFTDMPRNYLIPSPLEWPILIIPAALGSYFLIERPLTGWARKKLKKYNRRP